MSQQLHGPSLIYLILYKDDHQWNDNKMWKTQAWNGIDRSELVSQDEIIFVSSTNYPI